MKAVILAGGKGTRLRCVVKDVPKPMAPVNGRPFLEFLISRLVVQGFDKIVLSVGYLSEKIIDHFGDGSNFNASISYCVENVPLGTGGAIREVLLLADDEDILVMNGDTFAAVDIKKLVSFHKNLKTKMTMAVIPRDDAARYGSVHLSSNGLVTAFTEKDLTGSGLINSGVYVINKALLASIPSGFISLESNVLPVLAIDGQLAAHIQDVPFIDIGVPVAYDDFCRNSLKYTHCSHDSSKGDDGL